jgi:hypothetical protein
MARIPQHAHLARRVTITANEKSPHQGKTFTLEEWKGTASDGYKTGYESVQAVWLRYILDGKTIATIRYTGKNLRHVDKQFADLEEYAA